MRGRGRGGVDDRSDDCGRLRLDGEPRHQFRRRQCVTSTPAFITVRPTLSSSRSMTYNTHVVTIIAATTLKPNSASTDLSVKPL